MLRITTDQNSRILTLRLEGRLDGPWVEVLAQSWCSALDALNGRQLCVDLTGVTFIDAAGKDGLAQMYERGAQFIAEDLMTKAFVAEIVSK